MQAVKQKPREMFKRFKLHFQVPSIARAQRLTTIRGPSCVQQPLPNQLHFPVPSTARAQRLTIIRGPLCVHQLLLLH